MKKYLVVLRNRLFNKKLIIEAENFEHNYFVGTVTFKNDKGNNVALFNKNEIKFIKEIKNIE